MTQPTTRSTFKDYCKRKLGWPVVELNIDDDQVEDCIDDSLQFFQEYHFDATETAALSSGNYVYDVEYTQSDTTTVERVAEGIITISEEATK